MGRTNAGKSLLTLKLARSLGLMRLSLRLEPPGGDPYVRTMAAEEAVAQLVSPAPHQTRMLQSIQVELKAGKGMRRLEIVDTSGLADGIPSESAVRGAMAQTLEAARAARIILHLIDAALVGREPVDKSVGEVDRQLAAYARRRGGYAVLANKMDLPGAQEGLKRVRRLFSGAPVFPVSALHGTGLSEVLRFVRRWA